MVPRRILSNEVIEGLSKRNIDGSLPVLLDFQYEDIKWNGAENMEDGHIRVINSSVAVWYQGEDDSPKYYAPCFFNIKLPDEDGKTIGDISVTVGFTDQSFIKVIRSVVDKLSCRVIATFQIETTANGETVYSFVPLRNYTMTVESVSWTHSSATFKLVRDSIQNLKVPRDMADNIRFPGIVES